MSIASTWINEHDVDQLLDSLEFAETDVVDKFIELLDPELFRPGGHLYSDDTAQFDQPVVFTDVYPPSLRSVYSSGVSETSVSASATSEEEGEAGSRRKAGGQPLPLDGLPERRQQQIRRRRERNRESMRRMRARYKGAKEQLHQLETELQLKKRPLLALVAGEESATESSDVVVNHDGTDILVAALKQKLLDLERAELLLSQEQVSLRQELTKYEVAMDALRSGLDELRLESQQDIAEPELMMTLLPRDDDFSWVDRILPLLPQVAETNDVFKIVQQSYAEVLAASRAAEKYLANANQVLGWRDTRMVNGTWMNFVFRKEIFQHDVDTIAERTWRLQSSGASVNDVMPQKHNMKILRKINDSTFVCARNLVFAGDTTNYCTIYLLMRVHNGKDGYVVAQRTLEPDDRGLLQQLLGPNHSYVSVFYGLMLSPRVKTRADGSQEVQSGCHVSFGGRVGNGSVQYASTWSNDILVAILRWETLCVGPILQLPTSAEGDTSSEDRLVE